MQNDIIYKEKKYDAVFIVRRQVLFESRVAINKSKKKIVSLLLKTHHYAEINKRVLKCAV